MPPSRPASRPRPAALRQRIARRFDLVDVDLAVGGRTLPFTRVRDPDRVLDMVADEADRRERLGGRRLDGDELHLPYWAELWDSALAVAAEVLEGPPLEQARVLDLGCGMGLAGVAALERGARALLVDLESDALLLARLNTLRFAARAKVRRLDWRSDRLPGRFDLILGADVLYDKTQWTYLDRFFDAHLAAGGGVLLGEPGRQSGDGFLDWVASRPWRLRQWRRSVPTRATPIRLLRLSAAG